MRATFMLTSIITLLTLSLSLISSSISMKTMHDQEKSSPFECGFDPKKSSRLPFSMHFFLIAVIFLIFDVEIALILPLIIIIKHSTLSLWSYLSLFFILILIMGLYHEWNQGALEWAN
uniref:NADH-ubiquinone oxidoreductase chain 3 n=1 Tax=Phyllomimus sinicus TaxID=948398 RepID=A0A1Q1MPY7_9ORTH|nr:NADH dehydrogenase subunit 3 [Phyllomimus sinicus]AQM40141.1 NADH dehydrogenase subunit 3 [Phyllomimus sinicus]